MNYIPVVVNALVAAVALMFVQYTTRQQYRDLKEDYRDLKVDMRDLKQDVRDLRGEMGTMRSDLTQVALAVGVKRRPQTG